MSANIYIEEKAKSTLRDEHMVKKATKSIKKNIPKEIAIIWVNVVESFS